jgi:very-short-patch-repair endonuclease
MEFPSFIWAVGALLVIGAVSAAALMHGQIGEDARMAKPGGFRRRRYLMDSGSEFRFFRELEELMGHRFYVFPQVNIALLIDADAATWRERMLLRSRIDRKSVDFVLCDKDTVAPRVAIELDGPTHRYDARRRRDAFVDQTFKSAGIPFVRIGIGDMGNKLLVADKIFEAIDRHEAEAAA